MYIALRPIVQRDYGVKKNEGVTFHNFHWWLGFSNTRQDHNKKQDHKGEFNLKQVIDGSCNNARSCKMIIVPPFKLAKFVNEAEQHGGACFKP